MSEMCKSGSKSLGGDVSDGIVFCHARGWLGSLGGALLITTAAGCSSPATGTSVSADAGVSGEQGGGGAGICDDVHGVYNLALDTADSTLGCAFFFQPTQCTVGQSECSTRFSCQPNVGFGSMTIDAHDKGSFNVSGLSDGSATCTIQFDAAGTSNGLTWDCTVSEAGVTGECKGTGTAN